MGSRGLRRRRGRTDGRTAFRPQLEQARAGRRAVGRGRPGREHGGGGGLKAEARGARGPRGPAAWGF